MGSIPFDEYCARTGADSTGKPTYERLEDLQRAQLFSIPYENFDIHLGRPIELSMERLVDKLVRSKRGGYCFELNGLFLAALHTTGFEARPLLARMHLGGEPTGRAHQLSLVSIGSREWIVDVGFAMGPQAPLLFEFDQEAYTRMLYFGSTRMSLECFSRSKRKTPGSTYIALIFRLWFQMTSHLATIVRKRCLHLSITPIAERFDAILRVKPDYLTFAARCWNVVRKRSSNCQIIIAISSSWKNALASNWMQNMTSFAQCLH